MVSRKGRNDWATVVCTPWHFNLILKLRWKSKHIIFKVTSITSAAQINMYIKVLTTGVWLNKRWYTYVTTVFWFIKLNDVFFSEQLFYRYLHKIDWRWQRHFVSKFKERVFGIGDVPYSTRSVPSVFVQITRFRYFILIFM